MDLQEDFDTLKGRGDERHGDSAEEPRGADLRDGELSRGGCVRGKGADELFPDIVAPEADGEHGRDAREGRGDAGVETPDCTFAGDGLAHDVDGGGVGSWGGGL